MMKVTLIIPTYNEAENIKRLVPVLAEEFRGISEFEFNVLFVDGNSPDGTAEEVRGLALQFHFVNVFIEEKKAGLGSAYVNGFRYALLNFQPDILVEMDADFQHDPKDLKRLLQPFLTGADYVIGSRFTKGGRIPKQWAFYRKVVSIGGNIFSKIMLGVFNVNDFTSGFKASRVKGFVDRIDLDNIRSRGFAYKIDLLYKMHKLGAKIVEVPISFGVRDRGISKMERNNFMDSIKVVLMIRFDESAYFIKFCMVGFAGLVVDTGLFNLFRLTLFGSGISALVSGLMAMLTTFILNNIWSFRERRIHGFHRSALSFIVYILASAFPIFIRSKLVGYAVGHFGDTFTVSNTAFSLGIIFGLIWNFTVYSKIIWRNKS